MSENSIPIEERNRLIEAENAFLRAKIWQELRDENTSKERKERMRAKIREELARCETEKMDVPIVTEFPSVPAVNGHVPRRTFFGRIWSKLFSR